jgi:hypothetical protein
MVDSAAERLHAAMMTLVVYGTREPQPGSVPPQQQALVDQAQRAWLVVKNTPEDFAGRDVYIDAERQFAESVEARRMLSAMERLEEAAAAAALAGG